MEKVVNEVSGGTPHGVKEGSGSAGGVAVVGFTPGPWTVEDPLDQCLAIVEAGKETYDWRFIATCHLPDSDEDQDFTAREVNANARLISAAPEMLAALQEAVITIRAFNGMGMPKGAEESCWAAYQHSPEMKRINAAIAKATGARK